MKYAIYAENMEGTRRYLGKCYANNIGTGLFALYADECGDEEEIVIVELEQQKSEVGK